MFMRVQFTENLAGDNFSYGAGEIVDTSEVLARDFIRVNLAIKVEGSGDHLKSVLASKIKFDQFTEWREDQAKLSKISSDLSAIHKQIKEVSAKFAKTNPEWDPKTRAYALIDDKDPAEVTPIREELRSLEEKRTIHDAAINILQHNIRELEARLSVPICKGVREVYMAIMKRIVNAAKDMAAAIADEEIVREELIQEGVRFTSDLPPMGMGQNIKSTIGIYLRDMYRNYPETLNDSVISRGVKVVKDKVRKAE